MSETIIRTLDHTRNCLTGIKFSFLSKNMIIEFEDSFLATRITRLVKIKRNITIQFLKVEGCERKKPKQCRYWDWRKESIRCCQVHTHHGPSNEREILWFWRGERERHGFCLLRPKVRPSGTHALACSHPSECAPNWDRDRVRTWCDPHGVIGDQINLRTQRHCLVGCFLNVRVRCWLGSWLGLSRWIDDGVYICCTLITCA